MPREAYASDVVEIEEGTRSQSNIKICESGLELGESLVKLWLNTQCRKLAVLFGSY